MKKTFAVIASLITIGLLTGCTQNEAYNFDAKTLNTTPHWEIDKIKVDSWGTKPNTTNQTNTSEPDRVQTDPNKTITDENIGEKTDELASKDVLSYNYVLLHNSKNKCTLEGRISYSESYKQARGDLFNSKSYLYSLVDPSQNPISDETNVNVNGESFVRGSYTSPEQLNSNQYHMSGVRVFSTPVSIIGTTGFNESELGNYNSDLSVGLPTVLIDLSCPKAEDVNDKTWSEAAQKLKLSFEPLASVTKE